MLALLAGFTSCTRKSISFDSSTIASDKGPKNIIILIGDGMGTAQLSSSFYFSDVPSNFGRFKCIGFHQPVPAGKDLITDSAASATSIFSGEITYNAAISMGADTIPVETILEIAKRMKKKTGIVATCSVTHATPAALFAHVPDRDSAFLIARQFAESTAVDFAVAGGYKYFSRRPDGRNYLDTLVARGVTVDTTALSKQKLSPNKRYAFLVAPDSLPSVNNGRGNFLSDATKLAIEYLSQEEAGFFLMVEGSQIDWGCHQNEAQRVIDEVSDFDKAVGIALDFAAKDGNTLVIVTGDHETGGFALSAPVVSSKPDYTHITPTFSTKQHTASLIPVLAYGPGAEEFSGFYQNNDIFFKMLKCLQ